MEKIIFITTNKSKAEEINDVLKGYGFEVEQKDAEKKEDKDADMETVAKSAAKELCEPGKEPICFDGKMEGSIAEEIFEPQSEYMPYDSIFIPDGADKPICKMTMQEKSALSQRGKATRKLGEYLSTKN